MDNPWQEFYQRWRCPDEIERRLKNICKPRVYETPAESDVELELRLKQVIVVTPALLQLASVIIDSAAETAQFRYKDKKAFLRIANGIDPPPGPLVSPILVTGLAGIGKSQLVRLIHRVLSDPLPINVNPNYSGFHICGAWLAHSESRATIKATMMSLAEQGRTCLKKTSLDEIGAQLAQVAYVNGVGLIIYDELQFLSNHVRSGAAATNAVARVAGIGPLVVAVANFDLVDRVANGANQSAHRFLSRPHVLMPDLPDSAGWKSLVSAMVDAGGGAICPKIKEYSEDLWRMTAGNKRAVRELMLAAFAESKGASRRMATLNDFQKAFSSSARYYVYKRDTLDYLQYLQTGKTSRADIRTPLVAQSEKFIEERLEMVLAEAARGFLFRSGTAKERSAAKKVVEFPHHEEKSAQKRPSAKNSPKDAKSLLDAESILRRELKLD